MNPSIELIRLIAVILIVFTHTRHDLDSGLAYVIVEGVPTFGTAILSIISGYLYFKVSRKGNNIFQKKIKSLAIPFLIANISVLLLVFLFNYVFGYNALNRLSFDLSIITEGIFTLNEPPINPPTYFIRDIFVIFSIISLFTQREYKSLVVLIPFLLFGTLILRMDVAFLFLIGIVYAMYRTQIKKSTLVILSIILTIIAGVYIPEYLKFPSSFLLFILMVDLKFKFFNTGRYSYLLHLYHSPIMVVSHPLWSLVIDNPLVNVVAQILTALVVVYFMFLTTRRFDVLKVMSGGR